MGNKPIEFTTNDSMVEQYLYEAGKEAQRQADIRIITDSLGQEYIVAGERVLQRVEAHHDKIPQPDMIRLSTLDGLCEYIERDPDGIYHNSECRYQIIVDSPTKVSVVSPAMGYLQQRICYVVCDADAPQIDLGRYMDTEKFQVMLQTCFMPSENLDLVLKLAGSVRKEQNLQKADDGVSQKVTINTGVTTASDVIVKNPVELIPLRTFMEVDQPVSPFVLRFNEEGNAALFTGAGKSWVVEAKKNIVAYLRNKLIGSGANICVLS